MTLLDHVDLDGPLSTAMRTGSAAEHRAAEGTTFVAELLAGRLPAHAYADYLLRLRELYAALEQAVRARRDDPLVAAVHDPVLERGAAIEADLDQWAPHRPQTVTTPAVAAYRERVREATSWGGLLVAHHYTRYLGDLSGGQAIGRALDRTYDLRGTGTAFYAFPAIPRPKPYKDAYRARLDALPLSSGDKLRVVEEVQVAFRLNRDLLAELGKEHA